jgi:hypothetical protein
LCRSLGAPVRHARRNLAEEPRAFGNDQLVSEGRVFDATRCLGSCWALSAAPLIARIEFSEEAIVIDDVAAVSVEQGEQPPEDGH